MGELKLNRSSKDTSAIEPIDEEKFKELFLKYYQGLCNFAYNYLGSTHLSEEVVQEVFANFWEKKKDICHDANLKSYLYTSVRNRALDLLDKQETERKYISKFVLVKEMRGKEKVNYQEDSEFVNQVKKAVNNLPERARMIYMLSRKEGLTYKEIAKTLDISIKTVESQMVRALKILRKQLVKYLPIIFYIPFLYI